MQENRKQARTVAEEMVRERNFWRQNQIWSILLIVVVVFGMLGRSGVSVAPGAGELLLTMHDGSTAVVEYDDMLSVELLSTPDYGSVTEGKETRTGKSGTWEHPRWGSYTLCVIPGNSKAILVKMDSTTAVFCCTTDEKTQTLFESYSTYLGSLAA